MEEEKKSKRRLEERKEEKRVIGGLLVLDSITSDKIREEKIGYINLRGVFVK